MAFHRKALAASVTIVACLLVPSVNAFLQPNNLPLFVSSRNRASVTSARPMRMGVTLEQFDAGGAEPERSVVSLDSLVARAKITELVKQTSDVEGAKQVLFNLVCYSVFATAATSAQLLIPATLGMAFVMSFNFMCLHETVHRSAFKSRLLNDAMMHVAGFSCLRPAQHYFYYHWGHHKYTGNAEKDSELQPSALDMDVSTLAGYILYISGLPFWFDAVSTTLRHALGVCTEPYLSSEKSKKEISKEARIYTLLYAALAWMSIASAPFGAILLKFWVIPSLLGQPFLRFYLFAEHRGCPDDDSNITRNTRTMNTNWFYSKLAWNMPYHLEHHAWPYVPFHKLGDAHKLLRDAGGDEVIKGPCSPQGDSGYTKLNWHFIKSLFKKKSGPFPSGAA